MKRQQLARSERSTKKTRLTIAWGLVTRTNQRQGWIAEQLGLRSDANVSQQVRRAAAALAHGPYPSREFKQWSSYVKI